MWHKIEIISSRHLASGGGNLTQYNLSYRDPKDVLRSVEREVYDRGGDASCGKPLRRRA